MKCLAMVFMLGGAVSTGFAQPSRIVFFGDSITELGAKPKGYVSLIRNHFKASGSDVQIVGAGVSGNRVPDLLARVNRDVLALKPTLVIIFIGINDVWHFSFKNLSGTPKDEFRSGIIELVRRIRNAGAEAVLCTPSVIGEKLQGQNPLDEMLDSYAEIIRTIADKEEVALCDLRTVFLKYEKEYNTANADKGLLTTDGVHLTEEGNRIVADTFIRMLEAQ